MSVNYTRAEDINPEMFQKSHRKQQKRFYGRDWQPESVVEAAVYRLNHAFDLFDHLAVSFSGGKDSTIVLELAVQVARERNRLPLRVIFFDEEAIPYETEHYVRECAERLPIDLEWYCVPVQHRNACSPKEPFWWCWDPDKEDLWVRPMPPEGRRTIPGVQWEPPMKRPTIPQVSPNLFPVHKYGRCGILMGIRAQESFTRLKAVSWKKEENYVIGPLEGHANYHKVYPIYDWRHEDVWTYIRDQKIPYCEAYDLMEMAGVDLQGSRLAPPYGEEPIGGLWQFAVAFPDVWERMITRVPGASTAARYARTELYDYGRKMGKPENETWRDFVMRRIQRFDPEVQPVVAKKVRQWIRWHYKKTTDPIMPTAAHPLTGVSWQFLVKLAVRGDFKNRTQPKMSLELDAITSMKENYLREREEVEATGRMWEIA